MLVLAFAELHISYTRIWQGHTQTYLPSYEKMWTQLTGYLLPRSLDCNDFLLVGAIFPICLAYSNGIRCLSTF